MLSQPAPPPRHHVLIAGTGRSGTSFLVRYLTGLGLDTHLSRHGAAAYWDDGANAGLEDFPHVDPDAAPYVVKTPWAYEFIDQWLDTGVALDCAILPIRDLADAAASRVIIERQTMYRHIPALAEMRGSWSNFAITPGGTLYSLDVMDQARLLAVGFHHLVQRLVAAEVPIRFLAFPRSVEDADYLFRTLEPILPAGCTAAAARAVHDQIADRRQVRVSGVSSTTRLAGAPTPTNAETDRAALARELVRRHAALNEMALARQSLDAEAAALRGQLAQDASARDRQERAIAEQAIVIDELKKQIADVSAALAAMHDQRASVADTAAQANLLRTQLQAVEASASWRLALRLRSLAKRLPGAAPLARYWFGGTKGR